MKVTAETFDAIVLDRILPSGLRGLGFLATLRTAGIEASVLILSALSGAVERVRRLRAGSDDYLTKPFSFLELTARWASCSTAVPARRNVRPCRMSRRWRWTLLTHTVAHAGKPVELLAWEFRLLQCLKQPAVQIVAGTMLFEELRNYHHIEPTNVIDMHIGKPPFKLDPEGTHPMIDTVRGTGYIFLCA